MRIYCHSPFIYCCTTVYSLCSCCCRQVSAPAVADQSLVPLLQTSLCSRCCRPVCSLFFIRAPRFSNLFAAHKSLLLILQFCVMNISYKILSEKCMHIGVGNVLRAYVNAFQYQIINYIVRHLISLNDIYVNDLFALCYFLLLSSTVFIFF